MARRPSIALRGFLEANDPAVARLYRVARKVVLDEVPDANELIYDAYNALTTAYSFTDRLAEVLLPDPERMLVGKGARIRHVRIAAATDLQHVAIRSLLRASIEQGRDASHGAEGAARAIVKAVYAKKRRPS